MVVNLSGRGDKDLFTVASYLGAKIEGQAERQDNQMTRIDRRFAELKQAGRAGLVTFITAGDPDYDTSLAILQGLPEGRRRPDRARHAVLRSDGRRAGDPGLVSARAQGRPDHEQDLANGARPSAQG